MPMPVFIRIGKPFVGARHILHFHILVYFHFAFVHFFHKGFVFFKSAIFGVYLLKVRRKIVVVKIAGIKWGLVICW